jgi:uncharacterized protein (TIGR02284 family)
MEPENRPGQPIRGAFPAAPGEITLALRSHAFLSGLQEEQAATLAEFAELVQFPDQELVLAAQQISRDFYLLVSGSVSIELNHRHCVIRIQSLGPGEAFGWSALLEHHDTLFDVRTREHCTALRLDGERLAAALRQDPLLAVELLKRTLNLLASRVYFTELRLAELFGVPVTTTQSKTEHAAIGTLNKLIEVCMDGELGYRTAAERVNDSQLRSMLTDHAIQRRLFADRLGAEVERLGGSPRQSGTVAASLHRSWIALKAAVTGGDAKAIVAACGTGEVAACKDYEAAMNSGVLLNETKAMIETQKRAIDESRKRLLEFHQELVYGSRSEQLDSGSPLPE